MTDRQTILALYIRFRDKIGYSNMDIFADSAKLATAEQRGQLKAMDRTTSV